MTNAINNVTDAGKAFAKAAATTLEDNLQFCKSISTTNAEEFHGKGEYSNGDTILVSLPDRSVPTSDFDQTSTVQPIVEKSVPLKLDIISSQMKEVTTIEYASDIQISKTFERIVKPMVVAAAHDFEAKVIAKAQALIFNSVGTAGSNTFDTDTILSAREKLGKGLCPKDDQRFFLFDGAAGRLAVGARKGQFQDASEIAKQYKNGLIGRADGFNWLESEMLSSHTNGNDVVFEVRTTVSTQGQETLVVEALTATTGTVKKGTVFTVAGVYAVHPQTKRVYSHLQQFVVTDDATADGSGYATLSISPAMYTTGALQNINSFPQDGAAITPVGAASTSYVQNLAYHKDAFRLVTVPLFLPENAEFSSRFRYKNFDVAIWYGSDIYTRKRLLRVDMLGAVCAPRPEWACRVTS